MYRTLLDSVPPEGEGPWIFLDSSSGNYLGISRMEGPEWFFVTAYPRSLLLQSAHKAAFLIFGMGVLVFLAFMTTVAMVLRKRVAFPVGVLEKASEAISQGNYTPLEEQDFQDISKASNEVGSLARTFHKMAGAVRDVNRTLEQKVVARTSELAAANKKLEELSLLDPLTKIFNRRAFDRDLEQAFTQAREEEGTFALMLCDVDFFKQYNDTYGHNAGDRVLQDITRAMLQHLRPDDRVYRYGGEEIIILFNGPYPGHARSMAERILEAVRNLKIEHAGCPWGILTVSAGLEEFSPSCTGPQEMIHSVDQKLYKAKEEGRDRLEI
jgi:diguanylate cyclase (GGDEF)-like protein